jgi:acetate---CoA ligase (ADP-forming)
MTGLSSVSPDTRSLRPLFDPGSVAVIGASDNDGNRGGTAVRLLRKFGYRGAVYPVHPAGHPVAGYSGYARLADLPAPPDVAVVAVAAARVPGVLAELGEEGVRAAIVWAGGFAETGPHGAGLQRQVTEAAAASQIRLIGPNCLGVVNTESRFTGTFASWLTSAAELLPGTIGMVSQSGGLAAQTHDWLQRAGTGLRYMISTGNEADVTAVDALQFLAADPGTSVICCYLEGLTDGAGFLRAAAAARAGGKSVVALKGGRSAASARAVTAHTGNLAGQGRVWDDIARAAGVIQVFSVEELVEVAAYLASRADQPPVNGNRVAVLSYGGGQGVLAADQCTEAGLDVVPLSDATRAALAPLLPSIASTANPVDLTPEAFNQDRYRDAFPEVLDVLDRSGEIDLLLLQLGAMAKGARQTATSVSRLSEAGQTPVMVQTRHYHADAAEVFGGRGLHVFEDQSRACQAAGRMARVATPALPGDVAIARAVEQRLAALAPVRPPRRPQATPSLLAEHQVHELLSAAGLPALRAQVAHSAEEAALAASQIGFPVALKVVSDEVIHRAAAGLLRLGVADAAQARHEFTALTGRLTELGIGDAAVLVQEMSPGGTELLVSAFHDETFGRVVCCGAGGTTAELIDDVAFGLAPLDVSTALGMLRRLRTAGRLMGLDIDTCGASAAEFLVRFSQLVAAMDWGNFVLELNPVSVSPDRAIPLDVLLVTDDPAAAGSDPRPGRLTPEAVR